MICHPMFNLKSLRNPNWENPGLSQGLASHHLSDYSSHDAASLHDDDDSVSSRASSSRDITPDTSLSQRMGGRAPKKLKKRARPEELHQ